MGGFALVDDAVAVTVDEAGRSSLMTEFGDFAEQALPGLLRYGHALTGSPHDAADLVQGVLERVGSRWSKVRRADDPLAYVRRAMANDHVSRWRRNRREIPVHEIPERIRAERDRLDGEPVWQALGDLPPRQRAVIVLRYYEGMSEAEIADALNISRGTVKSQASRALDKLRAVLDAMEGEVR